MCAIIRFCVLFSLLLSFIICDETTIISLTTNHVATTENVTVTITQNEVAPQSPLLEFPKNGSKYPFKHDEQILANLAARANYTEVVDLRSREGYGESTKTNYSDNQQPPANQNKIFVHRQDTEIISKESEWIENGQDTEDTHLKEVPVGAIRSSHGMNRAGLPLLRGQLAGIIAGVFVALCVMGYLIMLSWRRFLENRYGNREMLVNEADFLEPNDMRHFSL